MILLDDTHSDELLHDKEPTFYEDQIATVLILLAGDFLTTEDGGMTEKFVQDVG